MRVAILSLNPRHNHGGILQSYALKKVLEGMGHDVRVICKKRHVPEYGISQIIRWPYRFLRKLMGRKDTRIFIEHYYNKQNDKKYQNTDKFVDKYLNPRFVRSLKEIKESEFDAFVVGSDQVWRPRYFKAQFKAEMSEAYLSFTKDWDVKRIAYSASFGVDRWEYSEEETKECAKFLKFFDAVSVREESGIRLCKKHLERDAYQLCDPTFLLTRSDYLSLIPKNQHQSSGSLLVYSLDENEELDKLVQKIIAFKGLEPFYLLNPFNQAGLPSLETWINSFIDAACVLTDSYHACIFSLIFNKPFFVINNDNRGCARIETLLKTFNQQYRLIHSSAEYDDNFNYYLLDNVEEISNQLRNKSIQFLAAGLS